MKFRLVQINELDKKNGWNLMFGNTFIRSFHWSRESNARFFLSEMNAMLEEIDSRCPYTKELIVKDYPHWIEPPDDYYCGNSK